MRWKMAGEHLKVIRQSLNNELNTSFEKPFLVLFCLYSLSFMWNKIGWKLEVLTAVTYIRFGLLGLVTWGSAVYLFFILAECLCLWESTFKLIITGLLIAAATALFSRMMTRDSYAAVLGIFFCILSYGKDYRKILRLMVIITSVGMLLVWLATFVGITVNVAKPNREFGGCSFGMSYPNIWAYYALVLLMLVWYLYLQSHPVITAVSFGILSAFLWFVVTSRTCSLLAFLFPVPALMAGCLRKGKRRGKLKGLFNAVLVGLPFLTFILMIVLCKEMEWIKETFYKTPFHTMAMRFVEGGYALQLNGVSLFGHPLYDFDPKLVDESYQITQILNSAYVADLIIRGSLWMAVCLGWIAFAHWRCLKNSDYGLLAISICYLILAMMERPALDVWFNYVLLYPLGEIPST